MDPSPTCSRRVLLQIFLVPEVSTQVPLVCMDLRLQTLWEASLVVQTVSRDTLWQGGVPRSQAKGPTTRGAKMPTLVSIIPSQCTRNVAGKQGKQSHQDHFYRKQRVYYTDRLRRDNFSKVLSTNLCQELVKYLEFAPYPPLLPPSPSSAWLQLQETLQS
jgi:hypothetical protein